MWFQPSFDTCQNFRQHVSMQSRSSTSAFKRTIHPWKCFILWVHLHTASVANKVLMSYINWYEVIQCLFSAMANTIINIGLQFFARGLSISHEIWRISHEIRWISCGFHEILGHSPHLAFIKLKSFCWNTCFYNFGWISQVISGWNLPDFTGEICLISRISWNLPDFMKSAGFQGEICQISQILRISWNLPDFTGEICWISWISWNPVDFMKSTRFQGEIQRISRILQISWNPPDFMKSPGFHGWNPPDFTDFMKSAGFHEIHRISRISWMWAFGWWSSIGLSIERPIIAASGKLDNRVNIRGRYTTNVSL